MQQIKELREKTGAGMVDCQKALTESNGDMNAAVEILRKKGIAKAAKRTDRDTSEGVIKLAVNADQTEGYIVEVNAETDFVALNEKFQAFADSVLNIIKEEKPADLAALLALPLGAGTVQEELDNLSGTIGEKLGIKRFAVVSGPTVSAYSHLGGRIGAMVVLSEAGQGALATDIAMQVAAANPRYLLPEEVPAEEVAKEKEIYREQLLKEGKPENMIDKISEGKLSKFYAEICLVKQEYIKDDKKSVEQVLGNIKINQFVRFSL